MPQDCGEPNRVKTAGQPHTGMPRAMGTVVPSPSTKKTSMARAGETPRLVALRRECIPTMLLQRRVKPQSSLLSRGEMES